MEERKGVACGKFSRREGIVSFSATDIGLSFAGVRALSSVSLDIKDGELLGVIGPNGSGKSTLFNVMSGIYQPDKGGMVYGGESIVGLEPGEIVRKGIVRTFQNKRLFGSMTVLENVMVATLKSADGSIAGDVFGLRSSRSVMDACVQRATESLEITGLSDHRDLLARDLPYGAQNRLEIARSLALEPALLLLDEPAAGLNPTERTEVRDLIHEIHKRGVTVVLVEHDVRMVIGLCTRVVVLDHGEVIANGPPTEVVRDPRVVEAYFGVVDDEDAAKAKAARHKGRTREPGPAPLTLSGLEVLYGKVQAVSGVDIEVKAGEVVSILGANGAGKSSIVKAVIGLVPAARGKIRFDGQVLGRKSADVRVGLGMAYVPEGRRVFGDLSVLDNLRMGAYREADRAAIARRMEEVFDLFPILRERKEQTSATLSGGEQQMLAIGRALMRGPKLLLLDEPSLGLAPVMVKVIYEAICKIAEAGTTILLAEQSAHVALQVADRAYVLETGQIVFQGMAEELEKDEAIRDAYLGTAAV